MTKNQRIIQEKQAEAYRLFCALHNLQGQCRQVDTQIKKLEAEMIALGKKSNEKP